MEYELIRSERKTVEIRVTQEGEVVVRAPYGVKDSYIDNFVLSKVEWIEKTKAKVEQAKSKQAEKIEGIRYLGNIYPISREEQKGIRFTGKKFVIPAQIEGDMLKKLIATWYKKQARAIFEERLAVLTEATGTSYTKLRISGARTRWGSCTENGVISLSWKLIMAEGRAIDYVILHELAHTIEMNHSDDFWNIVEGWLPGYKEVKQYLKDFSFTVASEGWNY